MADKNLPVSMIIVEPTAIAGKHVEVGTVIKNMETELAMDLAGSGKARPATDELIAEFKARAKEKEAAEKAKLEAEAVKAAGSSEALASMIATAVAQALSAKAPA
jgi:ketopantoate hydroxymethyltransferase